MLRFEKERDSRILGVEPRRLAKITLPRDNQRKAINPRCATAGNARDAVPARWNQGVPVRERLVTWKSWLDQKRIPHQKKGRGRGRHTLTRQPGCQKRLSGARDWSGSRYRLSRDRLVDRNPLGSRRAAYLPLFVSLESSVNRRLCCRLRVFKRTKPELASTRLPASFPKQLTCGVFVQEFNAVQCKPMIHPYAS